MRILWLVIPILITSCSLRVEEKSALITAAPSSREITWPSWTTAEFSDEHTKLPLTPDFISGPTGEVITYGKAADGSEHFVVISEREKNTKPGILQLRQCLLPTSIFAGPNPIHANINELVSHDRAWSYSTFHLRSAFFDYLPALTPQPKGLIVYRTSIMLLSSPEKKIVTQLRKKGWHILVGLPPDSLYRTKLPALSSPEGSLDAAADLIAEDMDRHHLEQARSTQVALEYLAKKHPSSLTGKRILMGTSAGTFGLPAEALKNPGWDGLIFVSGGVNLLSMYESGSAGVFDDTMKWVSDARKNPPKKIMRIFTNDEYHEIFRRAAERTQFHAGALAPKLHDQRILMISGTLDQILPSEQAADLYQALGKPERWTAPLGHHLIALKLIYEVDRIDRWIMND